MKAERENGMTMDSLLIQEVQSHGGILPFDQFMSHALYYPEIGYYMREGMEIGKEGDFVTSPTLHPIFADLICLQLLECWIKLGRPNPFRIIEWGAGNGALAARIVEKAHKMIDASIQYEIVEKSPSLRKIQERTLAKHSLQVIWKDPEEYGHGSIEGVLVSNELFDALPAKRYQVWNGKWVEMGVVFEENQFHERLMLLRPPANVSWLDNYLPALDEGDRVDVSLESSSLMEHLTDRLHRGYILTFDYGDRAPEVYETARFRGNIRAYYKQQRSNHPLKLAGLQDLTCDVNFSLLEKGALAGGGRTIGFTTQAFFLERLGFLKEVQRLQRLAFKDLTYDFELQTMLQLYIPTGLGQAVKALAIAKGDVPNSLRGFEI